MTTKDQSARQPRPIRLRHVTPPSFSAAPAPVTQAVIALAKQAGISASASPRATADGPKNER